MNDSKYIILRVIGEGSFGRVFQGRLKYSGHVVAMKYISKYGKGKDASFLGEVEVLRSLEHENIIQFLDYFETDNDFVVVTEFGQGDLSKLLEEDKNFSETEIHWISRQLIYALKYLHDKNITHRDLKPQNILIDSNGTIKLCDFGFARILDQKSGVMNSVKGTPLYMAPEIINGGKSYDWRSDLWSLGALLYELFVGKPPFVAESYGQLIHVLNSTEVFYPSNITEQFASFLRGLLQKDPDKRFTWSELLKHSFITEINTERQKNSKFKPGRKFVQRLNDMEDYMPIAHTDMQMRDPALCKTQDEVLMKKRSSLQTYLLEVQKNSLLLRPNPIVDFVNKYGVGKGDVQLNRFKPTPFIGGPSKRKQTFNKKKKERDEESEDEYSDEDEDENEDYDNEKEITQSKQLQLQQQLELDNNSSKITQEQQQKLNYENTLQSTYSLIKPISSIRRSKSCPSKLFIGISRLDLDEDLANYALQRDNKKKGKKHNIRKWDDIIAIVNDEDQIQEMKKIDRKNQRHRANSCQMIMTKIYPIEIYGKEMNEIYDIENMKEFDIYKKTGVGQLKLKEIQKLKKQNYQPLIIHPPVLHTANGALLQEESNNDQNEQISAESESNNIRKIKEEEDSDEEEEDENDEDDQPDISSLLPYQRSLDQIIDDTFAIHDQLPSNRSHQIISLLETYSAVMQAPLLSDEDAFLCFTYDIRTIRYGGMPYDYIWMELPTFISPLPSFCSYVRPTLDQFPLSLSSEQKHQAHVTASLAASSKPGETKLGFKSCVDTFLVPSPPIPTWLSVRWGVMRWMSLKESIPAFLGLAHSCSERAQRIVVPQIRSSMSIPSLTVDEMFAETNTLEALTLTALSQTGIVPIGKATVISKGGIVPNSLMHNLAERDVVALARHRGTVTTINSVKSSQLNVSLSAYGAELAAMRDNTIYEKNTNIPPQSQNINQFSSSSFSHTSTLAIQQGTSSSLQSNAPIGNIGPTSSSLASRKSFVSKGGISLTSGFSSGTLTTGSGSQHQQSILQMQQLLRDLISVNWFDVAQKFLIAIHGLTHLIRVIG
ncbi:MAG: putative Serine/threonine-protein kinase TIO, partial [Streblomastix strix]